MHEYRILIFVHTFLYNREKLPEVFSSYFVQNSYIQYYNTRRKCDLHLASMYSAVGKKTITNKGCNLWNKLPENIKTVGSYNLFRKRLKQHYLELI